VSRRPHGTFRVAAPAPAAHPSLFAQLDYPVHPPARIGHATQERAARTARFSAQSKCGQILDYIRSRGTLGATIDEVETRFGFFTGTVCARVNDLSKFGYIRDSKATRRTRRGCDAIVWIATDSGEVAA
jgi:hypothetical protein